MFRVDYYSVFEGTPFPTDTGCDPTSQPTSTPTSAPTGLLEHSTYTESPPSDTGFDVVRNGIVIDHHNGNYTVQLCPVIAGVHEIHLQRDGSGVSNHPVKVLSRWNSRSEALGLGTHEGQYISAGSPYKLIVSHSVASGMTSTAAGPGLRGATVGVPASFTVTVRDAWENVLRTGHPGVTVTASLDRSPGATVNIFDFNNGSYNVEYVPVLSGDNLISVYVDGFPIRNSPFTVPIEDGSASSEFSFAVGPGLISGRTGDPSYFEVFSFDVDGNRKADFDDVFYFEVSGSNTLNGYLQPCPSPPISDHPICSADDALPGHYFGVFVPLAVGEITVDVYLETQEIVVPDAAAGNDKAVSDGCDASTNASTGTRTRRALQEVNITTNGTAFNLTNSTVVPVAEEEAGVTIITIRTPLFNSPFTAFIVPSAPTAENSDVAGESIFHSFATHCDWRIHS